jgi:MFS family permease
VSDRLGRRVVLVLAYGLSIVTTIGFFESPATGPWLALALAAMGLVVYAESPLLQAYLADEAPARDRDALFSLYFAVAFGVGALWAAFIGVLLQRWGYGPVFIIMAASYAAAGLCVLAMKEPSPAMRK